MKHQSKTFRLLEARAPWSGVQSMGRSIGGALMLLVAFAACNSNASGTNKDKNKLPVELVNNPHTAAGIDTVAAAMKPTMDFKDSLHDFGTIRENEVVQYEFGFTNNGKSPLIITSATGSCGCTVADYPRDAVAPGKSAVMKVTFNSAGKTGHQEKTVTIRANTLQNIHLLHIKADISIK